MNEFVLDASVVLKWFHHAGEAHTRAALRLRAEYEAGRLVELAPPLLHLEIINVAARRWKFDGDMLLELAETPGALGFELRAPELTEVAQWCTLGLTAYDASYVALADLAGVALITDDARILTVAPNIARSLTDIDAS